MRKSIVFLVFSLMILVSCSTDSQSPSIGSTPNKGDSFNPPQNQGSEVSAVWNGNDLAVTNNTSKQVYFLAFPQRLLPVILITTVTNPRTDLTVAAQTTKRFPRSRFSANSPDTLSFMWWHLGRKVNDSLYNADSVRGFNVYP